MDDNKPSVSIVLEGNHSVIVIGFTWTELLDGTPRADGVYFHDPINFTGEGRYETAAYWKQWWFTLYNGVEYAIIVASSHYVDEGKDGYVQFEGMGGTYYGCPEDEDPKDPIE